jgi:hypothetical protein
MVKSLWCNARHIQHDRDGRRRPSRRAAWRTLRWGEELRLCFHLPAGLLQARDCEALLPDGARVPTPLLRHQAAVLRSLLPDVLLRSGGQVLPDQ